MVIMTAMYHNLHRQMISHLARDISQNAPKISFSFLFVDFIRKRRYNKINVKCKRSVTMELPFISSEWKVLFRPEKNGNYVNDHAIVKGPDGLWHLYGITSFGGRSYDEKYFVHAVGKSLDEPFEEKGRSIDRGTPAWSPCVIEKDGVYHMFYGPSPTSLAVSFDMYEWFGHTVKLKDEPLMAAHRDHFVLRLDNGSYLMYVSGVHDTYGAVSCFSSDDLLSWRFRGFALTTRAPAPLHPGWGAVESPFVVQKDGLYYLFVTYTDCSAETYNNTLVFVSEDPLLFGCFDGTEKNARPVAALALHAPEILQENGRYYVTTCGWRGKPVPHEGCVSIAELQWK